ncbi:EF-hand domain-containing protein [Sphingomonas xanthus]|uniref:EF-hand domain-containing protein n=1 Tax=Sphingomonas xanthus TaxID=2594473 RepID=A0A516IRE2_9SPHN|nr:EF-hand domain-containing protein [Sphingomonas xanthus]QDP19487.1 hypothetical protein FMM02_05630 [Sphingomonas xanthus]
MPPAETSAVRLALMLGGLAAPALVAAQSPAIPRTQFIADMDAEFRKMDADKNGLVTRVEIEQYQRLTAVARAEARNRQLFAQLDTDRNGQVSSEEFIKLVVAPQIPGAQSVLGRMDSNRDQQVSLIEHRAATLANFDRLDSDKDGIVTPAEMKAGGIAK